MVEKFIANGEDLTEYFYWPPPSGGPGIGVGSQFALLPFSDKARSISEKLRQWGRCTAVFYFQKQGSNRWLIEYVNTNFDTVIRGGKEVATITMKVVQQR